MLSKAIESGAISLNAAQNECINSINGQYLVLAGAGTGKTTVIINRIERLIDTGVKPSAILILTYSQAAANEMKDRLISNIGSKATSVAISTYHAYCNDLINENILQFELYDNFKVIDDLNKYRLMRETIDEYVPKYLTTSRNDPYFYIKSLLDAISEIKLNRITEEQYFATMANNPEWQKKLKHLITDKKTQEELEKQGKRNRLKTTIKEIDNLQNTINKAEEVWKIFEIYEKRLKRESLIDFNDMINLVLNKFEDDPEFLANIRSNIEYIMVDEYQDTNHSQNELIFQLAGNEESTNLFVVGDDDQIIYTFQGARVDNIQTFLKNYPKSSVICLTENNRSSQQILDLSYKIISQDAERLENNQNFIDKNISKKLLAANKNLLNLTNLPELHIFSERVQEVNYILDKIDSLIELNNDIQLSEIAIIARTNYELKEFADQLKYKGLPYQIHQQRDIFSIKASIILFLYLKAIVNPSEHSSGLFGIAALPPFNFNPDDYTFIMKELHKHQQDFITIIKNNLAKRNWKDIEAIRSFINTFTKITEMVNNESISSLIINAINDTGLLEFFFKQNLNRFENIASLNRFIDEANSFENNNMLATLESFLIWLENSLKDDISLKIDENTYIENAIQLITVHKAKGREFDNVFLTNLAANNWEKKKSFNTLKIPIDKVEFSKESEVARLLYVACTRSRKNLVLSLFTTSKSKSNEISCFIGNIAADNNFIKSVNHNVDAEQHLLEIKNFFYKTDLFNEKNFINLLKERARHHVMSPTSLNDYNSCPKLFLFKHIYKIPLAETFNKSLSFGIAIHESIEKYIRHSMKMNIYSNKDILLKYFHKAMEKQMFQSVQERDRSVSHGKKVLDSLYASLISTNIKSIEGLELRYSQIPYKNNYLNGRIDCLQRIEQDKLLVCDYKTGTAKSESLVINEDGAYHCYYNQIRFYKLLVEIDKPKFCVSKGVIYFVESPEKSIHIELTEEDTNIVSQKIDQTYLKIQDLEFEGVDEENQLASPCNYCEYKMLCKLNAL